MDDLFEAIREECNPVVWSRGVQLTRAGTIDGKRTHNDEIEVRIVTRGGMVSPLVVLSPNDQDWSCECPSTEAACVHVVAAVVAVRKSLKEGQDLNSLSAPSAKLAYRFSRDQGSLSLQRHLVRGERMFPLETRLTVAQRQERNEDILASQADLAVDVTLGSLVKGKIPRPLMERLLTAMADCEDIALDDRKVRIGEPRPVIHVRAEDHAEGFRLVAEQDPEITEIFANGALLYRDTLRALGALDLSSRDVEELRNGRVYAFGQVADLVGRVLPALRDRIPVDVRSTVLPQATPMTPRLLLNTEFDQDALTVLPTLVYGDPPSARVDGGKLHYLGGKLPLRSERKEQRLLQALDERLGLHLGKTMRYTGDDAIEMAHRIRAFEGAQVSGKGLDACFVAAPLEAQFDASSLGLGLSFTTGGGDGRHATTEAVVRAWQRGESLVPLSEGGWAPIPADLLDRCGHLLADLVAAKDDDGNLPSCAVPDLARLCEALDQPAPPSFERLRTLVEDFRGIPEVALPEDLRATLRDYQREGVNWLHFLSDASLGAMLADDMGLGKTLQALCALRSPTLVVAPASVVHNWALEVERFRPGLKVHTYHGPRRVLDPDADITLTTYALLRLDAEALAQTRWDTVILDEAQNIKNENSQVALAAFELDARFRITLTGTPVENRLEELWSQFHFINRGLLGGRSDFQERYAKPIADGDSRAVERLRRRIRPFILRRLKREVASELPPRTDVVVRCTLSDAERDAYNTIRAATQKDVLEKLQLGGNVMAALEALLRLRQACCHRGLLPQQTAPGSSKIELLMEMLDKVVAEGHKALVFSQWTGLLDLVEPHLERVQIPFVRLDGATRDRGAVVSRFQEDEAIPLMLISLKAGGTGLNLTAADNVFLLDPWWNPAVEDQAADRAHRIGQERPVLVQRLVAEDTVEERMLALQDRKRALAEAATGQGAAVGGLTREDLLSLLS